LAACLYEPLPEKGDDMMKRLLMLMLIMTAALLVVACGTPAVTPDEPPA
jgi:hypothetical protein